MSTAPPKVTCAGCGRAYDLHLFRLGRTIHCTCGSRVGREERVSPAVDASRPRFIADSMLGRLARWLRTLGFDTVYDDRIADEELVRRAFVEGRYVLTRDRALLEEWRIGGALLVTSDAPLAQLHEVVAWLRVPRPPGLFSRCRVCNGSLQAARPDEVDESVPGRVRASARSFRVCRSCGRVYWEGSHTERMRAVLDRVFAADPRA